MPAVDGLRAIAIVSVVAFHAGFPGAPGGFVGVDVFFVISGFLIIGQIMAERERGTFSILDFYARRTMRILPAYFVMLASVTLAAVTVIVAPDAFEAHAKAAIFAPLMATNILFLQEQGYFDPAVVQKPLIHTWTLAVEEQFYLVIPLALVALHRAFAGPFDRRSAWLAGAIGAISFAFCLAYTTVGERNPAFYLTPFRAWEFIGGGLAAGFLANGGARLNALAGSAFATLGVSLIAAAVIGFSAGDAFPSWRASVPVAGAFLVILGAVAAPNSPVARALSHPIPVRIGLLSYSWYLWHWPAISLATIAGLAPLSWRGVVAAVLVGYLLAELSWRFIETPVRRWRRRRAQTVGSGRIFNLGVASAIALAVVCGGIAGAGYLDNRFWLETTYGVNGRGTMDKGCTIFAENRLPASCLTGDYALLLGDSHAQALAPSFTRAFDEKGLRLVTLARGACEPRLFTPEGRALMARHRCANLAGPLESVLAAPNQPKLVLFVTSYSRKFHLNAAVFESLAAMFDPASTRMAFVGPLPAFPSSALTCVVRADRAGTSREACALPRAEFDTRAAQIHAMVRAGLSGQPRAIYTPIDELFCDARTCRPWSGDTLFFRDSNHLFPVGADRVWDALQLALE